MQEPEIIRDEVRAQVAPDIFKEPYGITDEQAAQNLLAEEGIEFQSRTVDESIAKFNLVQQLTSKRNMRDNTRRTKILSGHEKIMALVSRFN